MTPCPKCGKELYISSEYCPWCGNALKVSNLAGSAQVSPPPPAIATTYRDPFYSSPSEGHSHRAYYAVIGLLLIVIVVLAAVGLPNLFRRSNSSVLPVISF